MSKGKVQPFVDYTTGPGGDTGLDDPTAIRPILNGEDVVGADPHVGSGGIVNRPGEHLRRRTEKLREVLENVLYLQGADRALLLAGPGRVTWPGPTTTGQSGVLSLDGPLFLVPALTPGAAQALPIPPVASRLGRLVVVKADGNPGLVVSSLRRSYEGGDRISLAVVPGTSLAAEAQGVPARTILLTAPPLATLAQVASLLGGLTADEPQRPLVNVALAPGAASNDLLLVPQARQYMEGNFDGEGHTLMPSNLATFFTSNPESALAEGDTLCIQYAKMIDETGSLGGRRQSTPENSNTAIPAGSFFNSRVSPEKLTNAIPVCKVVGGRLVFHSGAHVPPGAAGFDLGGAAGASISYAGGPAWRDGTTNPATTVEAQLDKIIADLAGVVVAGSGAHKIGVDPATYDFGARPAETLAARLNEIVEAKANRHTGNLFTASQFIDAPGETDAQGHALVTTAVPTSEYKPLAKFQGVQNAHVRLYLKKTTNGFGITSNAAWDPATATWSRDNTALSSSLLYLDQDAFVMKRMAPGVGAWADDHWTLTPFSYDLATGLSSVQGEIDTARDIIAGGNITSYGFIYAHGYLATDEPDVRHGDRTKILMPSRIETGWLNQGTVLSLVGNAPGAAYCDLDLAVGDRVKLIRVIYTVVGTNVVDAEIKADWLKATAPVGPSLPGLAVVVPFAFSVAAGDLVKSLDLVPPTPVVMQANENHVIRVLAEVPNNTTKDIYRVEVVYDRP